MAVQVRIEERVKGLADLRRTLLELPERIGGLAVRRSLLEAAGVIRDEARILAPVREIKGGGHLRKSVISQTRGVFRDGKGRPVEHRAVVLIAKKRGKIARSARAYAHFVEFGTRPHSVGKASKLVKGVQRGLRHPGAKPKPFLRPAFDTKKFVALRTFEGRMRREIAAETAKLAARVKRAS
jgi:HK97 gp10 family phage protein